MFGYFLCNGGLFGLNGGLIYDVFKQFFLFFLLLDQSQVGFLFAGFPDIVSVFLVNLVVVLVLPASPSGSTNLKKFIVGLIQLRCGQHFILLPIESSLELMATRLPCLNVHIFLLGFGDALTVDIVPLFICVRS